MVVLSDLPLELLLHIISFLTVQKILPGDGLETADPDLPSINALCQTNSDMHFRLNQTLYNFCASDETVGRHALLFAVKHQLENTVDQLVAAGVSLDGAFDFNYTRCSLLHLAAALGLRDMVAKLLGMYGEDAVARVHAHGTPLDYAVQHGHLEVVKLLAPILSSGSSRRPYLNVALREATKAGDTEISGYLISLGADVDFQQEPWVLLSPLYYATDRNNLGLVQLLLASGADPNLSIPLFRAAYCRYLDIAQALVEGGADINARDREQRTVLTHCTNVELLRFFLERGVDPNTEDRTGRTALHHFCAIWNAQKAPVELLIQFGAAVDKTDGGGHTAMDFAMSAGFSEIVKLLEPLFQSPSLRSKVATWWEERAR
ncbi:ankyrin repeat-containing domain protein [Mycena galopus ATCC 62051]|nr:ankyrin repeat-containing domain protein [Mycena galopus ATCC 62051]